MAVIIDNIHKVRAEATPVKTVQEYDGPVFKTTIKNARDEETMLQDDRGGNWFPIPAGREIVLCSWSPSTMYAPFSKVVFEKKGRVSTTKRFNFKSPVEEAPYSILLDNRDGGPQELVKIDDEYVAVVKGIPRRVRIGLADARVGCKEIRWVKKTVKEPAPGNRAYLISRQIIEKCLIGRKAVELRAIRKELEKEALTDARRKADQAFKRIQPVEVDDAETESQEHN